MRKGTRLVLVCCACSFFFAEAQAEAPAAVTAVTVSKIRIIIDEREYEWTVLGQIEVSGKPALKQELKPETIQSFLSVEPGMRSEPGTLEKRCREAELRLTGSGYFYASSVIIVPPKLNPAERTIIVSVTSGYLWRYGGGNAWAMLGKEGLGGERAGLRLYAGWNRSGAEYMHYRVGGIPLVLGGRLFYFGPGENAGKAFSSVSDRFEASATTGWLLHPDLMAGIDSVSSGFGPGSAGLVSFQPFASYKKFIERGVNSDAGCGLRFFWYPESGKGKSEMNGYVHAGLSGRTVIAVSGSLGYSPEKLPKQALFNLFYTEDRNVRSGYSKDELTASSFALCSAELRQTLATFTVPPAIDCRIQTFLFADAAGLREKAGVARLRIADAFGAGLRILFDNPVFAWFTFSYGINREGSGRFLFCGTAGY